MYNVVLVSGVQLSFSYIYICIYIFLFHIIFHYGLLRNTLKVIKT